MDWVTISFSVTDGEVGREAGWGCDGGGEVGRRGEGCDEEVVGWVEAGRSDGRWEGVDRCSGGCS